MWTFLFSTVTSISVYLQKLTKLGHHSRINLSLIPFFNDIDALEEAFVTKITIGSREGIKMKMHEMNIQ